MTLKSGWVTSAHGRRCVVMDDQQALWQCVARGRKLEFVTRDRVHFAVTGLGEGVIEAIEPRRSLFWRQDAFRSKTLAANIDTLLYVVAVEPSFSTELLTRAMVAADSQGIGFVIVLNKIDLPGVTAARALLEPYSQLGVPIVALSAKSTSKHVGELLGEILSEGATLLAGQSGMGKSTLINALIPTADAPTREISEALSSGKHTTTAAHAYPLQSTTSTSWLVDSPGFQQFAIGFLDWRGLQTSFREFRPLAGQCRFTDCRHMNEPGCGVRSALDAGAIHPLRYTHYQMLFREIEAFEKMAY